MTRQEELVWAAAFVKTNSLVDAGKAVHSMRDLERLAAVELNIDDADSNL